MGELQKLYELQQVELKIESLQKTLKELPVFAAFKLLQAETADAKEALGWAETKLTEQDKRLHRLEMDLQDAEAEQEKAQTQLFSNSNQSSKGLEQLERRSDALGKERLEKEEMLLLAMEGKDNLAQTLQKSKDDYRSRRKKLRQLQKTGNAEIQELKNKINDLQEQRKQLQEQISESLLKDYRQQRPRYNGKPLAHLENDCCSGCRVMVFKTLKSNLNQPNSKVFCENCGRRLVP
ncbi:MAG TPA: hypothetical protein VFC74_09770 [Oscillospiraceae bacterium]|nr:hypothetical protein [Oscillospiraceae bacterium]